MKKVQANSYVQHLRIHNAHAQAFNIYIEPRGEELSILPKATYEIVAEGPEGGCLEVVFGERTVAVYGWAGSVASVFNGAELLRDCRVPVPSIPRRVGQLPED
jgi:hypothetical protein